MCGLKCLKGCKCHTYPLQQEACCGLPFHGKFTFFFLDSNSHEYFNDLHNCTFSFLKAQCHQKGGQVFLFIIFDPFVEKEDSQPSLRTDCESQSRKQLGREERSQGKKVDSYYPQKRGSSTSSWREETMRSVTELTGCSQMVEDDHFVFQRSNHHFLLRKSYVQH